MGGGFGKHSRSPVEQKGRKRGTFRSNGWTATGDHVFHCQTYHRHTAMLHKDPSPCRRGWLICFVVAISLFLYPASECYYFVHLCGCCCCSWFHYVLLLHAIPYPPVTHNVNVRYCKTMTFGVGNKFSDKTYGPHCTHMNSFEWPAMILRGSTVWSQVKKPRRRWGVWSIYDTFSSWLSC